MNRWKKRKKINEEKKKQRKRKRENKNKGEKYRSRRMGTIQRPSRKWKERNKTFLFNKINRRNPSIHP